MEAFGKNVETQIFVSPRFKFANCLLCISRQNCAHGSKGGGLKGAYN